MTKGLGQQDNNSVNRWARAILLNGILIFSLYALGYGLYPQIAFVFGTIKVAYTVIVTILTVAMFIGAIALSIVNVQLNKLVFSKPLRDLYAKENESIVDIFGPRADLDGVKELEAKVKGPIRFFNLLSTFAIMALAYNIGAYYLMVIELLSEIFLLYFLESGKATANLLEKIEKISAEESSQE